MTWIADRTRLFDSSGIRKVFDLAGQLKDPINLSIGQPDFEVPAEVRQACIDAIESRKNGYSQTQGIPLLREKLQQQIDQQYGHGDRRLLVTSGTSGALVLAIMCLVNPGDEVVLFDPYFVMYEPLVSLFGGKAVLIDTYPDFRVPVEKVEAALTTKTKLILLNSPGNPTGAVASRSEAEAIARLAAERNVVLISDEIYRQFCYDEPFTSPAEFNDRTLVIDGFSKSHAMTGWRIGWVHGPAEIIEAMTKLQQYTFVCAPQPAQWAGAVAMDVDIDHHIREYRRKRDMLAAGLEGKYELSRPGGAFYAFPKAPGGSASEFVKKAIEHSLLIIPGQIFSRRDTHFRISYAADDRTLERGIEVLRRLC